MSQARVVIVGLGRQGRKRLAVAKSDVIATVDPVDCDADYKAVQDVPIGVFDAALLCVPDSAKLELIEYLVSNGKSVLVEKPLINRNQAELERIAKLVKARNVACYTAYNHRFEPHFVRMHDAIRSGVLGRIYSVRMFYGNGTARLVRDSQWRDRGAGVLTDLGSHLLDTLRFWFSDIDPHFAVWSAVRSENLAFDQFVFGADGNPRLQLETTYLSWRNEFYADLIGELGSAHIFSLCKWGPSTFSLRRRVFPCGRPEEDKITREEADPTWAREYEHFKAMCRDGKTNIDNDIWINRKLGELASKAGVNL